jgi:CRISPR-associated endoribonuclease Cas6
MRLHITFSGNQVTLPLAMNEIIQGLIYNAIGCDSDYSSALHNVGCDADGRKYKLFTFSELRGKYEIYEKNITFLSEVQLTVSAYDAYFMQLLVRYFIPEKSVRLGNNTLTVKDAKLESPEIHSSQITVRSTSPITVYVTEENGKTTYYSPADPEFYDGIVTNARRKWISAHGNDDGFNLHITPKEGTRFIKRKTRFKSTYITAWHGSFILRATPEILTFLSNTGIGTKNSQGFGAFDVIKNCE